MAWRKHMTLAVSLLLVIALLAGCGGGQSTTGGEETQEPGQNLVFNLGAEPPTLDPALCTDNASSIPIYQMFEGLTQRKLNQPGVEGAIAETWDLSPDGLEYVFHLRDGVKWTSGEPVTAEDFEFAWKRVIDPRTASDYAYQLYLIEGAEEANTFELPDKDKEPEEYAAAEKELEKLLDEVEIEALDPQTLRVKLVAPTPYFLDLTAFFTFMPIPKAVVEAKPEDWAADEGIVTNGPFKLTAWEHKSHLVLAKNEDYWDKDKVKLNEIKMVMISDPATSLTAYENGETDMCDSGLVPLPDTPRLLESGVAKRTAYLATYYLDFNNARKPLDDPRVRRALSLAIDRQSIVDNVTKGGQIPAFFFVPPGIPNPATGKDFREEGGSLFEYDVDTAKQLLADAGYPNGEGFPKLTLLYNTEGSHKDIMQAIQAMWKDNLGVQVELGGQEWKVFLKTRVQGDYDIARDGWIGDFIDPVTFLDLFTSTSQQNNPKWFNKDYDALINEAKLNSDQAVRMEALHEAEKLMIDEMPISPIYIYTQIWLQQDYVKDVMHDIQSNWGFKYAYIEK